MQAARSSKKKVYNYLTKKCSSVSLFFVAVSLLACPHTIYLCRDDDDINDVASMAGVNLSEESANILATNSGMVGAVTRSCKDETFLACAVLQRRMLEIGEPLTTPLTLKNINPSATKNRKLPFLYQAGGLE